MSYLSLSSYNGGGSQVGDFYVNNSTTNFRCSFREPILIKPNSYVKLNFVSAYLLSDANKSPIFITSPTFTTANSRMTAIGHNGLLGMVRLGDEFGAVEGGTQHSLVVDNSFPYIAINNVEPIRLSEIQIKIVDVLGGEHTNIKGYSNSGNPNQDTETQTLIGLHIIDSNFKDIV